MNRLEELLITAEEALKMRRNGELLNIESKIYVPKKLGRPFGAIDSHKRHRRWQKAPHYLKTMERKLNRAWLAYWNNH
jgi:hypothetical protein